MSIGNDAGNSIESSLNKILQPFIPKRKKDLYYIRVFIK